MQHVCEHKLPSSDVHGLTHLRVARRSQHSTTEHRIVAQACLPNSAEGQCKRRADNLTKTGFMTGYKCNGPSQPAIHYNIISESWYISVSYFKRRDLAKRPLVGASCFKTQVLLHPRPCLSSTCSADYASSPVGAS